MWTGIDKLLRVANQHLPIAAESPEAARHLDHVLTAVSLGRGHTVLLNRSYWGIPIIVTIKNLASIVSPGVGWYLRRCARCGLWFLAPQKRQMLCKFVECRRRRDCERQVQRRRRIRDDARRTRVTTKGTKRTS